MTARRYDGDCCPACGSHQVIPYAVLVGASEEYGYQCLVCEVMWPVLILPGRPTPLTRQAVTEPGSMSAPALALAPVLIDHRTGAGASTRTLDAELLDRATREDYHAMARHRPGGRWLRPADPAARHPARHRRRDRRDPPRPGHRRPAGQGDLRAVRGPARLGLPALRRDLPGRHLPAHPGRARRRQGCSRVGRHPPVRVRHLHRPLLRARPHPGRHSWREGGPLPSAPQGQLLPARAADLLRPAAQRRRRLPGQAAVPGLLRLPRGRRVERARPRAVAPHRHQPSAAASASSPRPTACGSSSPTPRWPSSSAAA